MVLLCCDDTLSDKITSVCQASFQDISTEVITKSLQSTPLWVNYNAVKQHSPFQCEGFQRRESFESNALFLLGFGFDGTASFRKGASQGPRSLREVFHSLETYSPYLDKDLCDRERLFDLGDLSFGNNQTEQDYLDALRDFSSLTEGFNFQRDNIKLITLGGEHSISYAPLKKYLEDFSDLAIIHLDAHADLRDGYCGFHYSHASIIRRVLDHFGNGHNIFQYGIRSGTRDEFNFMKQRGTLVSSRGELKDKIQREMGDRPIYVTLDLDFFDPGFVPGTGTPEAGGEDFSCFLEIIKLLNKKTFVGADIVELAPNLDSSGQSSVFAAKVLRECVLAMT